MEHASHCTRRQLFLMAGAGLAGAKLHAAGSDFWNKKPPSQWTSQEIDLAATDPTSVLVREAVHKGIARLRRWHPPRP